MSPTLPLNPDSLVCSSCGLTQRAGKEHAGARECITALQRTAALLVEKLGTPRPCSACRATIYMIAVRAERGDGAQMKPVPKPYDANGQSHFLSCPEAAKFYSKK